MATDSLNKIRKNSDLAITMVPTGSPFSTEQIGGGTESTAGEHSLTSATSPYIPMYITVPGFTQKLEQKGNKVNLGASPGTGVDITFMMLISPESMNVGKTGSTQFHYTRKGYITQLWGHNQDTITANGRTAAFWLPSEGLTNHLRKYTVGFLNFMALVNAYKNNGYRMVDRTQLNRATRVIDVVHGITITYDGNSFMGHFNNFTLDEDAEHPFLLNYNFEFIVSAYNSPSSGDSGGMNELYGHYLKASDDLIRKQIGYKVRTLDGLQTFKSFPEDAIIEPDFEKIKLDTSMAVQDLWVYRTGRPWSVAVRHGLDKDPGLYNSLTDPMAYAKLIDSINGVQPADFARQSSTLNQIEQTWGGDITNAIDNIGSTVYYAGSQVPIRYKPSASLMTAIIAQESSGDAKALSRDELQDGRVIYGHGLMQIIDATGADLGYNVSTASPQENIQAGANYLAYLLTRYNGNEQLAMAAYNGGTGAVDKWKGVPLNGNRRGVQNYVANVSLMETWVAEKKYSGSTPQQVARQANQNPKAVNQALTR